MPRQEVNIGIEGNDGTGDSIRQSFKKVNENFIELYAIFGIGGTIDFTSLGDTPDDLIPGTIPLVNTSGTELQLVELVSNAAEGFGDDDTIQFRTDISGKLVVKAAFGKVGDDNTPILAGTLNANNFGIVGVKIDQAAANQANADHPGNNFTVDDLVINKAYADQRFITKDIPLRPNPQPTGILHYSWVIVSYDNFALEIDSYYNEAQELQQGAGHGITSASNGLPVVFTANVTDPNNLTTGTVYYLRVVSSRTLWLYTEENKDYAKITNPVVAEDFRVFVSGDADGADGLDIHRITDAAYDETLAGNFLSNVVVPRNAVTLRSGDTMTGPLYLNDHPGELAGAGGNKEDFQAATKYYVDNTAFSSPEVLYVSTAGDDTMEGVPTGKEGTAPTYAFSSINAAARRAEELISAAPATPGPYMQTITYTQNDTQYESAVMRAEFQTSSNSQARKLLLSNKTYIQKEVLGYIAFTYPDFSYNIETCERDVGLLIDAIAFDINKGLFANYLTIEAAKRYYSSVSGRKAITSQLTETVGSIEFAKNIVNKILSNEVYLERSIFQITKSTSTSTTLLETTFAHGYSNGNIIILRDIAGMDDLNGVKAYVRITADTKVLELYTDAELSEKLDTSAFPDHIQNTGIIGLRYQIDEDQYFDSGISIITNATQNYPVKITTAARHFLDDNDFITITEVSGMTELNDQSFYIRRVNDYDFELYTSQVAEINIINLTEGATVTIETETDHNLSTNNVNPSLILITGLNGATQLNNAQYYAKVITSTTFEIYTDQALQAAVVDGNYPDGIDPYEAGGIITQNGVNGLNYTAYTSGGKVARTASAGISVINAITGANGLFDKFIDILEKGLDAADGIVYGSTYKLVMTNGSGTGTSGGFVDQTNPSNADVLPGKVCRGKRSNALGRVVRFTNSVGAEASIDPITNQLEINPTQIDVHLLSAIDFEVGEPIEFGNFITKKEVVIRVEAGNYYEDYPIRLMNNVSLKGDEFRRVIIQPKNETGTNFSRVSQSKWASTYFYRDNDFDDIPVARGGTPFYNQENLEQGKFGYHYLYDPTKPMNIGSTINNLGEYTNAVAILKANKDYIIEETNQYIKDKYPDLIYNETKSRRDTGIVIDSLIYDLENGGEDRTLESQGSFHELGYTDLNTQLGDSSQEIACQDALDNIRDLAGALFNGQAPSYTEVDASFTPGASTTYTFNTGFLELDIGTHTLNIGDYIEVEPNSLSFSCASDGYNTILTYPGVDDPAYQQKLEIINTTATTVTVDVGIPDQNSQGYSVHQFEGAAQGAVTVRGYTAGSDVVTNVEPVKLLTDTDGNPLTAELATTGKISAISQLGALLDKILFVFNVEYNPPLRNDQMDVFLLGDTTIVRNLTCRGHGGFMAVLDPAGQILTKSPYLQTCSSFSKAINRKHFAGGMFVDAYVGNLPTRITSVSVDSQITTLVSENPDVYVTGYLVLNVESAPGQGLRIRPPQLPCPFYVEGRRFQVNAISDYDQPAGTATIYLDASSNSGLGYAPDQFTDFQTVPRDIFLQTAGNRSILGNDYTQVNDLGYGLVCTNGAFSEMVSMFTYYCQVAYYAKNGAEIRSLNGSNGYGNFGLVAEGADPNEIPDQVTLVYDLVQPLKAYTNLTESMPNSFDEPSIYVYDAKRPVHSDSIIIVNHPTEGRLNYRITTVRNLSDTNNNGIPGEAGDVVATGIKTLDQTSISIAGGFTPADGTYTDFDSEVPPNAIPISQKSTSGTGTGVGVYITVSNSGANVLFTLFLCGQGYQIGDTITFDGTHIGGASGTNDITITVSDVFPGTWTYSPYIYQLDLRADTVITDDYFGRIQEDIPLDNIIDYRDGSTVTLTGITDVNRLVTRPSTAVNFDEDDVSTYRSINFQSQNSFGVDLAPATTQATFEISYDYIDVTVVASEVNSSYGAQGTNKLIIEKLNDTTIYADAQRIVRDARTYTGMLNPGDPGYVGGTRFVHDGKVHEVTNYYGTLYTVTWISSQYSFAEDDLYTNDQTGATFRIVNSVTSSNTVDVYLISGDELTADGNWSGPQAIPAPTTVSDKGVGSTTAAIITFTDVANTNINPAYSGAGLNSTLSNTIDTVIPFGTHADSTAEITIAISLCRATGHDFTQIGTGSFNDSNYPNVILGDPVNALATYYSSEEIETAAQVWERRKGRVFFVSTDQYGFFRVGKFFEVDQGTGSITFAGEIGLSNANSLGFKRGVVISEFSVDDGFVDDAADAVPTEKAVGGYIRRVLGFDPKAANIVALPNTIGPGVLPRDGSLGMTAALDMQSNKIENVLNPTDGSDAANKKYVDEVSTSYFALQTLKDFGYNQDVNENIIDPTTNQMLVGTGNFIMYTETESGGTLFAQGDYIGNAEFLVGTPSAEGIIVKVTTIFDKQQNKLLRKIVYTATLGEFNLDIDSIIYSDSGATANSVRDTTVNDNLGGPYPEFVEAALNTNSDISLVVSATSSNTDVELDIKDGVIYNVHVNAQAGIVQSKLSMNFADTYSKTLLTDDGTETGALLNPLPVTWTQDNLGLATFHDTQFNAFTPGFIELKTSTSTTTGITVNKLQWIPTDTVLGRSAANTGAVSTVTFATVVNEGGGIMDSDFPTWDTANNNPPAGEPYQALVRTGSTTYTAVNLIANGTTNNSVVRRTSTGQVRTTGIVIGGDATYEVLAAKSDSATTIQLKTPGQRVMIQGSAASSSAVTVEIPDKLNVGEAYVDTSLATPVLFTTQSSAQAASGVPSTSPVGKGRSGKGFVATNWVYTKAIEAIDEAASGSADSTGIAFGADTGFTESGADTIVMFVNGSTEARINTSGLQVDTISSLSANTNLALSGNGTGHVRVNDKLESTGNLIAGIGSGGPALTVNDGAGDANVTFNHTDGKPEQIGNAARIEVNTDSQSSASFNFELKSNVQASTTVVALTTVVNISESETSFYHNILPDTTANARNIGSDSRKWNNLYLNGLLYGTATQARYADLAENYVGDRDYDIGTVLIFGGENEVTVTETKGDKRVAGVVSEKPAYLMNSELKADHVIAIGLQGRVPCKVVGKVTKGDMLVTSAIPGYAIVDNDPRIGTVLGKAVGEKTDDGKGVVEIVVGRV